MEEEEEIISLYDAVETKCESIDVILISYETEYAENMQKGRFYETVWIDFNTRCGMK